MPELGSVLSSSIQNVETGHFGLRSLSMELRFEVDR